MKANLSKGVIRNDPATYVATAGGDSQRRHLEGLLKQVKLTLDDVEYIYLFISRDVDVSEPPSKQKAVESVTYYFQCADGHYDYKYVPGLYIPVPVKNLHQEMTKFFTSEETK